MSLALVYKREARSDIAEIHDYYESQRVGLGDEFLEELTAVKDRVFRQPKANRPIWGEIRRGLFSRFPYGFFYRVTPSRIEVIAVYHHSRDPAGWQGRV